MEAYDVMAQNRNIKTVNTLKTALVYVITRFHFDFPFFYFDLLIS